MSAKKKSQNLQKTRPAGGLISVMSRNLFMLIILLFCVFAAAKHVDSPAVGTFAINTLNTFLSICLGVHVARGRT